MKKLALAILLSVLASPTWATTYFLAPAGSGGNDSNNGTSANTPWLTPNHAVNCGDVILAAASTAYVATNFRPNQWGKVTCLAGNDVAWLKCAVFDTCKITVSGSHNAMTPTQSFWGVQGWEVTATAETNQCFEAYPPDTSTQIHHIIFANNVANGCYDGAFAMGKSGSVGVDYLVIIGNIAFNAAQGAAECYSGIDLTSPVNSDFLPGTHYYVAGNFSWDNVDPSPCAGGTPSDGQGIFFDTIQPYAGQMVIDNNISVFNGGNGIKALLNSTGTPNAKIYFRHNTTYGNETGKIATLACSEIYLQESLSSEVYFNLSETGAATGCNTSGKIYVFGVSSPDLTDLIYNNYGYSAAGNNTTGSGPGFSFGPNNTFSNPNFVNPVEPPAPNCGSFASVPACMATVIADFTPTNPAAAAYGYQVPSTAQTYDPLFPQWLCNVNLPPGLVTMGCLAQSALPASPKITSVVVQ